VRFEQQEKLNEGEHLFKTRLYVWKKRIGRFTGSKKEGKKEDKNEVIQLGQSHKEMAVDHIQWSGWSDNGVLGEEHDQDVHTLVELIGKGKKVVVHCSDGKQIAFLGMLSIMLFITIERCRTNWHHFGSAPGPGKIACRQGFESTRGGQGAAKPTGLRCDGRPVFVSAQIT